MKRRIRIETKAEKELYKKKVRIKSMGDFEKLPEGEWVEVEGGDLEVELVEEVDAKLLISEEEVKIPVDKIVFGEIKGKKISIVPETN
ncbi:hypothetical protein C5S32_09545 [ANME-1 cluster archaeon GoMg1]|nr:hypothetical protein [ANME-1 cluster archaeon GoMg1]